MLMKEKGEWIRESYEVIQAFPFVQGVLYYTAYRNRNEAESEGEPVRTRFVQALDARAFHGEDGHDLEKLLMRDDDAFFPLQDVFIEDGVLYQVYRKLEGTLLAHYLYHTLPLPLDQAMWILRRITGHLLRLYDQDQFTMVHPQNVLLVPGGAVRFIYGGPVGLLPKGGLHPQPSLDGQRREDPYDAFTVGALAYTMFTGNSPTAFALDLVPIRQFRQDVPEELENWIMRTLSFNPEQRPTIEEMDRFFHKMTAKIEGGAGGLLGWERILL
jgi:serine/threonine protein kinase